jgi:glycosyltransferase involved in cell wall biosynthesis
MKILSKLTGSSYKKVKLTFKSHTFLTNGIEKSKDYLDEVTKKSPEKALQFKKIFFSVYKDTHPKEAILVGEEILEQEREPAFIKVLAARYRRIDNDKRSRELLSSIGEREYIIGDISKTSLLKVLDGCDEQEAKRRIEELLQDFPDKESKIYQYIFALFKDSRINLAIQYGMKYFRRNPFDLKFISILEKRVKELEKVEELKEIEENRKNYIYYKKLKEGELFNKHNLDTTLFKGQLGVVAKKLPEIYIENYINELIFRFSKDSETIREMTFSLLKDSHEKIALKYVEGYLGKHQKDSKFEKVLKRRILQSDSKQQRHYLNEVTKETLEIALEGLSDEEKNRRIKQLIIDFPNHENRIHELVFAIYKDTDTELAITYGMKYFEKNPMDLNFVALLEKRVKKLALNEELEKINTNKKDYFYFKKIKQGELFNCETLDKYHLKEQLETFSQKVSFARYIEVYVEELIRRFPNDVESINEIVVAVLKGNHPDIALKYEKVYLNESQKGLKLGKIFQKRFFAFKREKNLANEEEYCTQLHQDKLFSRKKLDLPKFKNELFIISNRFSEDGLRKVSAYVWQQFPKQHDKISEVIFSVLKDTHVSLAIDYGKKHIELNPQNNKFARVLVNRMNRIGLTEGAIDISKKVLEQVDDSVLKHIVFQGEMQLEVEVLEELYTKKEFDKIAEKIALFEKEYANSRSLLYRLLHDFYAKKEYKKSEMYALQSLELKENEFLRKSLYDLHIYYGSISRALSVLPEQIENNTLKTKLENGSSLFYLLKNGFDLAVENETEGYEPIKGRVLYLLHNRLPYNSGGYATRSHGLLTNVAKFGWNISGVSRLGYPWDKMPEKPSVEMDEVDNIKYYRLLEEGIGLGKLPMKEYLESYAKALLEKAKQERPEFIHAASNHMNGLVGNYVAKCLGIKSVYEVRGLWEITRISRQPEWKNTEYYELMTKLEAEAANGADAVLTLTEALKEEMVSRGVDADKITILPNGVTSSRFEPLSRDKELESDLNLQEKVVIGYIGSIVAYEGLEYLVDAIRILVDKGIADIRVLMVGDGAVLEEIQRRVEEKKLNDYFIFTGRVPHEEVERYYSLVDITPFPRKGQPVCEMVSPLKPFEAMAMEKAILSSNVQALTEIVQDGYNGMLFKKDNIEDLADKLEVLIKDNVLREKLGKQAREWVIQERDWEVIAKTLDDVYHKLSK